MFLSKLWRAEGKEREFGSLSEGGRDLKDEGSKEDWIISVEDGSLVAESRNMINHCRRVLLVLRNKHHRS